MWRKSSEMYVNVTIGMPDDILRRWNSLTSWGERVLQAEGADDLNVTLHWHPENPWACGVVGRAHYDFAELELCGTPSYATFLHELAHHETQDGHSVRWASRLMELHARWLPKRRALRADRSVAFYYPFGRRAYQLRYGVKLPRTGGGRDSKAVRKRKGFRYRSRIAAAKTFERQRTKPYTWEMPGGLG